MFERGCCLFFRVWLVPIVATLALTWTGCGWFCPQRGGEILVGQPEVFTRQRLVNRRLVEQQWLENQLANNTPTTQTLQGYQDVRVFTGIYSRADASFDPLSGAKRVAEHKVGIQQLENQYETSALQHQIDVLKLQQQLAALKNATDNASSGASAGSSGAPTSSTDAQGPGKGTSQPSPSGVFNSPPSLPEPAVVDTKAKITSIELLRDQLAWRNAVHAALREQELDDSHDLNGMALYTLKFDLSLLAPGNNSDRYAKIKLGLSVDNNTDCRTVKKRYESWFWHLRTEVHLEAVELQRRIEHGLLSLEEKIRLATAKAGWKKNQRQYGPTAKHDAERLIRKKYEDTLRDLVSFDNSPLSILLDDGEYFVPDIERPEDIWPSHLQGNEQKMWDPCPKEPSKDLPNTLSNFRRITIDDAALATVFVADPKEQAQSISDVAAAEKLRNMVLSLQASVPQYGLDAKNYTEYMSRSQERLQGILRRPLVVAYSDGGKKEFGWILGPRFEIGPGGKPRFNHTAVQHSVQVSVIVPGWAHKLTIPYESFWLNKNGETEPAGKPGTIEVELPGDDTLVTARLLAATGTRRTPFLEPTFGRDNTLMIFRLRANQPGDILIRGHNLWRNPKVFVGGQRADSVSLVPDMNGLSAHFDNIAMPMTGAGDGQMSVDLSVVTSEGIATLPGGVEIVSDFSGAAAKVLKEERLEGDRGAHKKPSQVD